MRIPAPLRLLWNAWMAFSNALGRVMSKVILTILWIVGFGPYALVFAILRMIKPDPSVPGSWHDVAPPNPESLRHPF